MTPYNIFKEFTLPTRSQLVLLKEKSFLTVEDVSKIFGYSKETIRKRIREGDIPAKREVTKYLIPSKAVYDKTSTLLTALKNMEIETTIVPEIYNRVFYKATIQHPIDFTIKNEEIVIIFDVNIKKETTHFTTFALTILYVNGEKPSISGDNIIATIHVFFDIDNSVTGLEIEKMWDKENRFDYSHTPKVISRKWRTVIYWIINTFVLKFYNTEDEKFVREREINS